MPSIWWYFRFPARAVEKCCQSCSSDEARKLCGARFRRGCSESLEIRLPRRRRFLEPSVSHTQSALEKFTVTDTVHRRRLAISRMRATEHLATGFITSPWRISSRYKQMAPCRTEIYKNKQRAGAEGWQWIVDLSAWMPKITQRQPHPPCDLLLTLRPALGHSWQTAKDCHL